MAQQPARAVPGDAEAARQRALRGELGAEPGPALEPRPRLAHPGARRAGEALRETHPLPGAALDAAPRRRAEAGGELGAVLPRLPQGAAPEAAEGTGVLVQAGAGGAHAEARQLHSPLCPPERHPPAAERLERLAEEGAADLDEALLRPPDALDEQLGGLGGGLRCRVGHEIGDGLVDL